MQVFQYWENRGDGATPHFIQRQLVNKGRFTSHPCYLLNKSHITSPALFKTPHIAQRADIVRAQILGERGGMYIDADALFVKNVDFLFDYLEEYDFVGFNASTKLNKKTIDPIRVGAFLCRPDSQIVKLWHQKQLKLLEASPKDRHWCRYGAHLLTEAVREAKAPFKLLPMKWFYPIHYKKVGLLYDKTPLKQVIKDDTLGVMTFFSQMQKRGKVPPNSLFYVLLEKYGLQETENKV